MCPNNKSYFLGEPVTFYTYNFSITLFVKDCQCEAQY